MQTAIEPACQRPSHHLILFFTKLLPLTLNAGSWQNTLTFFILAFDLSLDKSHVFHIFFCNSILTVESFTADLKSVAFHSLKKVTRQYAYQIQVSLVGAV